MSAAAPTSAPEAAVGPVGRAGGAGRRPALDGVRALAVASVAVYHFGGGDTSWLPGGYLGVDVFFVLSGYLITGLLLSEHARTGTISLPGFWVRRVKRLAPGLFLMLLVVVAWLWWATPPSQYPARRQDVFWTLGYLANWHLAAGSDSYFAAYNGASPLRHAWSLAIEEQFYLVWPATVLLLLWLGTRVRWLSGRRLVAGFALVAGVASAVALTVLYEPTAPSVAYFSTRGRVQELFAGVLLAVFLSARTPARDPARTQARDPAGRRVRAAAVAGLVVLVVALVLLPDRAALYYLGGAAGVSVAAALLIAGVETDPSSRLALALSNRPAVFLGRISYGVYLWHWPVVVAVPLKGSLTDHVWQQALRVALTLSFSVASFYLVERPVQRSRRALGSAPRVLVAVLATAGLVVAATVPATALPGTVSRQMSVSADRGCPGERDDRLPYCVWPSGSAAAPSLAIMGDSTARSLTPGLDDWARANGTSWVESAWKRCSATGLLIRAGAELDLPATACHQQARAQISRMLDRYRPATVLISEFWVHHQPLVLPDSSELTPGTPAHDAALRAAFLPVVDEIAAHGGRTVFLELAPPGETLGRQVARGRPAATAGPVTPGGRYVDGFNAVLRSVVAARPGVASTVSVTDLLCPGGRCRALRDGVVVRVDGVHYSVPFSKALVPQVLRRAGVTP